MRFDTWTPKTEGLLLSTGSWAGMNEVGVVRSHCHAMQRQNLPEKKTNMLRKQERLKDEVMSLEDV